MTSGQRNQSKYPIVRADQFEREAYLSAILFSFSEFAMASEHNKFRFPSLTSEEAVANCKSMFGSQVALSVDDLMRPQVWCTV